MEGLCEAAAWPEADLTLNAVVGMVGLQPTLAALQAGKALALANKETLVAGGAIVMEAARKRNLPILRWTASTPPFSSACKAARSGAP